MKKLLLETSFSKIYMIVMIIITLLILGGYFSYAMFTVSNERSNAISIITGNLDYELLVDGEESNKQWGKQCNNYFRGKCRIRL